MSLNNESMCSTVKILCAVTGGRIYLFLDAAFCPMELQGS